MSLSFNVKPPAASGPTKRVSSGARHWPLSSCEESPRWLLLPISGCCVYTENLLFDVATFINYLSWVFWYIPAAPTSALAVWPWTFMLWRWLLFLDLTTNLCQLLLQLPYLSQLWKNWRESGTCSGFSFGLRGCLGLFGLLGRSLKLSTYQQEG